MGDGPKPAGRNTSFPPERRTEGLQSGKTNVGRDLRDRFACLLKEIFCDNDARGDHDLLEASAGFL